MIGQCKNWLIRQTHKKYALRLLCLVAFAESSFFPIPPDLLLIPMVLARRAYAFFYAACCTISSLAGGMAGYVIGAFFLHNIGNAVLDFYGLGENFHQFRDVYNQNGAWVVLLFAISPLPYKLITIASGASGLNLFVFLVSSLLGRGVRFFLIAWLLCYFGPLSQKLYQRYHLALWVGATILLLAGFLVFWLIFGGNKE